jgi:hypothetical protein
MNNKIPKIVELIIPDTYDGYSNFFEKNRTKIYLGIIECFDLLSNSNRKTIKYSVKSKFNSDSTSTFFDFGTDFVFRKNDANILNETVLPYFEQIEEYEKCRDILNLYKKLTNTENNHILELTNV